AISSFKDIYWDIRPRPDFGTIEFRICDMPASLPVALGLVAMIRSLVTSSVRLLEDSPKAQRGDMRRHWVAVENKWLATRYGLGGMYIKTVTGNRRLLRRDTQHLVEQLMPVARESGDHAFLQMLGPIETFETGADRQRRVFRDVGSAKAVIDDMR